MTETIKINILGNDLIQEKLAEQRAHLPTDTQKNIDDFLAKANVNILPRLVMALNSFNDPERSFDVWKDYFKNGDEVRLRDHVRSQNISLYEQIAFLYATTKDKIVDNGKNPNSLPSIISRVWTTCLATVVMPLIAKKMKGNMTMRQEIFFEALMGLRNSVQGPGATIDPIGTILAPHLKKEIDSMLDLSWAAFKKRAKTPVLDKEIVTNLYDAVLASARTRFDALAAQSFGKAPANLREPFNFHSSQMPEDGKFGVECEGFTTIREQFPRNLTLLSKIFNAVDVPAKAYLLPKTDSAYDKWGITFDSSVVNPLHFTGNSNTSSKIANVGLEIVSRVLKGPTGLSEAKYAFEALKAIDFRTNETCGYHVHVSLEGTSLKQRKNLVTALKKNEAALDQLINPARRGNSNAFCMSTDCVDLEKVEAATTTDELVEAINPRKDRNHKFDLTGLVLPDAPETIHYRGEGGAGYLKNAADYTLILVRFTKTALDDPDIRLQDLLNTLNKEKAQLTRKAAPALA